MESNFDVGTIRALLSQGDTGKAVQLLIALLEKDARFKDNLLRTLRVVEANFNATRQQELKGILPFQEAQREYSKVNDTLLAVLDDFEAGRVPAVNAATYGVVNRRLWVVAGGVILLLGAVAFWLLKGEKSECPKFENPQAIRVMILPFAKLGGDDAKPALRILDGIQDLTKKADIKAEVKLNTRVTEERLDAQAAEQLARACGADLVVFGQYKAFGKDSIRVKVGYKLLKGGGFDSDSPFKTFRDITDVQPVRDLQDAIFSLCTMLAAREGKWTFAKRWTERIREKNTEEMEMSGWIDKKMRAMQ